MTPEPVRSHSALKGDGRDMEGIMLLATSTEDELAAAMEDLRERGVANPNEFHTLGAVTITDTVRWYDAQGGRVGAGVLVHELRAGGKPGWQPPRSMNDAQREYGESIAAWLSTNFPEFNRPGTTPHPAAMVAVIRLHHRYGTGKLTKRAHGAEIRAAVAKFDEEWGTGSESAN